MAHAADWDVLKPLSVFRRLGAWWKTLGSSQRRRIVLGSLLAGALAAWDVVLLAVVGSLFALAELMPAPRPVPRASS